MQRTLKQQWLPARMLMVIFAAGLLFGLRDRLPMSALSSDASLSGAVMGMIGRATATQNKVAKVLPEHEKTGYLDTATATELQDQLTRAGKDLTLAWNLMQSTGVTAEISGFYYARLRTQSELNNRLNALVSGSGSAEAAAPATGEEAPAVGQQ